MTRPDVQEKRVGQTIERPHARMVIGEAMSGENTEKLASAWKGLIRELHAECRESFVFGDVLVEDGGNMIVAILTWKNRSEAIAFHNSQKYRRFVRDNQHLLLNDFVVKLFGRYA